MSKRKPAAAKQSAADSKLFPLHKPLSHVDIELSCLHSLFIDMRPIIMRALEEIAPNGDQCWLIALEAMAESGERTAEKALNMVHAIQRMDQPDKAGGAA